MTSLAALLCATLVAVVFTDESVLSFPSEASVDNYVRVDNPAISNSQPFTVSFWVYSTKDTGGAGILSYATTANGADWDNAFLMSMNNRQFIVWLNNQRYTVDYYVDMETWTNLVVTVDSAGFSAYANGELYYSGEGVELTGSWGDEGVLILGQDQDSVGGGFDGDQNFWGMLGGINWIDGALDESQVRELYEGGLSGGPPSGSTVLVSMDDLLNGKEGDVTEEEIASEIETVNCVVGQEECLIYFDPVSDNTEASDSIQLCKISKKGAVSSCKPAVYDEESGMYKKWFACLSANEYTYGLFDNGEEGQKISVIISEA